MEHLPELVEMLFPQEVEDDDSTRDNFKFCAIHMTPYNRYAESVSLFYNFLFILSSSILLLGKGCHCGGTSKRSMETQ
jgi:hypothetical protein